MSNVIIKRLIIYVPVLLFGFFLAWWTVTGNYDDLAVYAPIHYLHILINPLILFLYFAAILTPTILYIELSVIFFIIDILRRKSDKRFQDISSVRFYEIQLAILIIGAALVFVLTGLVFPSYGFGLLFSSVFILFTPIL